MAYSVLFQQLIATLHSAQWQYQLVPEQEVLLINFEGHHGKFMLHAQCFSKIHLISVIGTYPRPISEPHQHKALELIMRLNETLNFGAYEMKWDDSTVCYRCSNLFPLGPHPATMLGLIHNTVAEVDAIFPFLGILESTPEQKLPLLNWPTLLLREDLLPPQPSKEP